MASNNDVLIKLRADLTDLQNGLAQANRSIDQMSSTTSNSMSGCASVISKIGGVVATAFAVDKVLAFGKTVVETTATFSDSMLNVKALTGASTEQFEKLQETALHYGSTTAHSSSQVADAMGYMALAGWDTTQIMDGLSGTLSLASAGGMDLATTSDILTDTMSMFGMEASECARASDVFAKVQASSNTNVQQLGEAMKYAGAGASAFGLDIEQASAMLGIMANNGIKASQGGTSLKNILTRLSAPTKAVYSGFKTLGYETEEWQAKVQDLGSFLPELKERMSQLSNQEQLAVADAIAGAEAMSGFLAIVNASTDDLPKLTEALYDCGGFAEETAGTMESGLGGAIRSLQSAWEGFILTIGLKVEAPLVAVIQGLTNCLTTISPKISEFWDKYGTAITVVAGSVATFLAVKSVLLALVPVIATVKTVMMAMTSIKSVAGAFTVLKFAMGGLVTCNPVILGISAVVGVLAGAGVLLYKNWDSICEWFKNMWDNLSFIFDAGITIIKAYTSEKWASIVESVKGYWGSMCDWFSSVGDSLYQVWISIWTPFSEGVKAVWDKITTVVSAGWQMVCDLFSKFGKQVWTIIEPVVGDMISLWETLKNGFTEITQLLVNAVVNIWGNFKTKVMAVVTPMINALKSAWDSFKTWFISLFNAVQTTVVNIWNKMKTAVMSIVTPFINAITDKWKQLSSTLEGYMVAIGDFIVKAWNNIKDTVTSIVSGFVEVIKDAFVLMKENLVNTVSAMSENIRAVFDAMVEFVKVLIKGWIDYIIAILSGFVDAFVGAIRGMIQLVQTIFQTGFDTIKAVLTGDFGSIKTIFSNAVSSIGTIFSGMYTALTSPIRNAFDVIKQICSNIRTAFNNIFPVTIKMPHFSMSGSLNPYKWITEGSSALPKVKVNWYQTGGIATGESIVGIGENGDEAIVPLSNKSRMKPFAEAVSDMILPDIEESDGVGSDSGVSIHIEKLVVREEADIQKVAEELYRLQERNRRKRGVVNA